MKITRELLRRWGACNEDARIAELVPEAGLTPLEFSDLHIPVEDRLWVLLREEVIPARELRLLACGWAEAMCRKSGWNDERSLNAIAVGRRYAHGEATDDELAAAARSAAESAEAWSAWAAAWEAARSAAWSAAWLTAEGDAATRSEQLADVVKVLRKIEGGTKE